MKARWIFLAALLALLLSACGRAESPDSPKASSPPRAFILPEGVRLPALEAEESRAMARFLNANRVLLRGEYLYCYDFDADWTPVLARYRRDGGSLTEFTVLDRDCVPEYLCGGEGRLYYLDRISGELRGLPEGGGERQLLHAGPCDWLCMRDGTLYFCDGEGRYLSLEPESGRETLLLEGPCSYAWPLGDTVLYISKKDGGRLHLCRPEDGADTALSEGPVSSPLIAEGRLWYCSGGVLFSAEPDGQDPRAYALPETDGAVELLPLAEGLQVRGIRDESGPVQWAGPPEGPFQRQSRGYRICDWLGGGLRVDTVYNPDGRIRCLLLEDEEGRHLSFLAGRTA